MIFLITDDLRILAASVDDAAAFDGPLRDRVVSSILAVGTFFDSPLYLRRMIEHFRELDERGC